MGLFSKSASIEMPDPTSMYLPNGTLTLRDADGIRVMVNEAVMRADSAEVPQGVQPLVDLVAKVVGDVAAQAGTGPTGAPSDPTAYYVACAKFGAGVALTEQAQLKPKPGRWDAMGETLLAFVAMRHTRIEAAPMAQMFGHYLVLASHYAMRGAGSMADLQRRGSQGMTALSPKSVAVFEAARDAVDTVWDQNIGR